MTSDNAVKALQERARARAEAKSISVLDAIQKLSRTRGDLSVSGVARAAGVSRDFLYRHPELRRAVAQAVESLRQSGRGSVHVQASTKADWGALVSAVKEQRERNKELTSLLAEVSEERMRWRGAQLEGLRADPEAAAELRATIERLQVEKEDLQRRVDRLERELAVATSDLKASRDAHAEDMAAIAGSASVTPISRASDADRTGKGESPGSADEGSVQ